MFDGDPHQGFDEPVDYDLAGYGLRGLDHRADVQLLEGRANRGGRRGRGPFPLQVRVAFVELLHLAMGAPAVIAIPRVTEIGVGDSLKAARCIEPRRQLVCEAFVLDEAVLARQSNSLFIEAFCVETPIFDARYLRRDQGMAILEVLRAGLRPDFKPLLMGLQFRQKLGSLVERRLIVVASRGQRAIEMVFGFVIMPTIDHSIGSALALAAMAAW